MARYWWQNRVKRMIEFTAMTFSEKIVNSLNVLFDTETNASAF